MAPKPPKMTHMEGLPEGKEWQKPLVADWVRKGNTLSSYFDDGGEDKDGRPPRPIRVGIALFYRWLKEDLEFAEQYREARAIGYDLMAQDTIRIADERNKGDKDDVNHRKLRIWARLQILARVDSGRYGDKIQISGPGGQPLAGLSGDEVRAQVLKLLARGAERARNRLAEPLDDEALN